VWHLFGDLHQDGPSKLQPCHVHQLLPRLVLLPVAVALAYPFEVVLFNHYFTSMISEPGSLSIRLGPLSRYHKKMPAV